MIHPSVISPGPLCRSGSRQPVRYSGEAARYRSSGRPYTLYDLDSAPLGEPCSTRGEGSVERDLNQLEVEVYRAALLARFGPSPEGCLLRISLKRVGGQPILFVGLKIWNAMRRDPETFSYAAAVLRNRLVRWEDVGFGAPVSWSRSGEGMVGLGFDESVLAAMIELRLGNLSGRHGYLRNLNEVFPRHAAIVSDQLCVDPFESAWPEGRRRKCR